MLITQSAPRCKGSWLLTSLAGPAPTSGDTFSSRGDVGRAGGQAHRRHTGVHLHWGWQLQKGDVIVEVLGVVIWVRDGLKGREQEPQTSMKLFKDIIFMVFTGWAKTLTLEIVLTWIGSLLYWRSCSPRITRCILGLEKDEDGNW